jgi:glycosyltransferase involved in cell wall biosynthesis
MVKILWLDPFHGGSHAAVAAGYAARSAHEVTLLALPIDGGWRWRMRGGAVSLARMARELDARPDLIVASDMLDLATFRALSADRLGAVPAAIYFHENQLTYPLPPGRQRDLSFAWVNYTSALAAEAVLFNSEFHRRDFIGALPGLLGRYHDFRELETIEAIAAKSQVLHPGIDLASLDELAENSAQNPKPKTQNPIILWNSRWEYDKQPERFFAALEALEARGAEFQLIVAGEHIDPGAATFAAARERWGGRALHWGFAPSRGAYGALLRRADVVVSSALQEFFGIGVVEAMYCGCAPVLPRRLNYPGLIPPALHDACLYDDEAGLVERLEAALARPAPREQWRALATPYGWARLAPAYDSLFSGLAGK